VSQLAFGVGVLLGPDSEKTRAFMETKWPAQDGMFARC
jgi:hypothetical protein